MGLYDYAKRELDIIGLKEDDSDNMNVAMRKHILHMINEFEDEGHSGFSASYALGILKKLLGYKPLTALTGADDEWMEVGDNLWQNKRAYSVFKDKDRAYWSDGIVFWEWYTPKDGGEPFKSYYTSRDSRVDISFPFEMPDAPEYVERNSNDN